MSLFKRHKHEWVATATKAYDTFAVPYECVKLRYQTGQRTEVLYRCECGKNKTKSFDGEWTLEQIRGKA